MNLGSTNFTDYFNILFGKINTILEKRKAIIQVLLCKGGAE